MWGAQKAIVESIPGLTNAFRGRKGGAFLPFKTECPPCESVMAVVVTLLAQINLSEVLYQYHVSEIEYNKAP